MNKEKILLEEFADYCHLFYNGCSLKKDGEYEYSYKTEVVCMIEGFLEYRKNKKSNT